MGTINYGTSKYITLGIKPGSPEDLNSDAEFMEWANEHADLHNKDVDEVVLDFIYEMMSDQYYQVKAALKKYRFDYYNVTVEPGYYEGFYINIEDNFPYGFAWYERQEANKEITELKKFLIECAEDYDLVECFPGWCTGYSNRSDTVVAIKNAVKVMRKAVADEPSFSELFPSK